ncbi:hypothetical protein ACFE04_011375 [Oxalis oulophora]
MFGFKLHIGGQFDFEHPISYVRGDVVDDWDIEPDCFTMDTLNRAINIMGQKGSVLTIHYNRPGNSLGAGLSLVETDVDVHSLVTSRKKVGSIDVYVVHMLDDEIGDKQAVTIPGNRVFLSPKKKRNSSQRTPNTSVTPPRTSQSESSTPLSFSLWKTKEVATMLDVKKRRVDGMLSTQGSMS